MGETELAQGLKNGRCNQEGGILGMEGKEQNKTALQFWIEEWSADGDAGL